MKSQDELENNGQAPNAGFIAALFLDSEARLRTVWRFLLFGIGFLLVNVAAAVMILFLAALDAVIKQSTGKSFLPNEQFDPNLLALIVSAPLMAMLSLGLVIGLRKWVDRRTVSSMGLVKPQRWSVRILLGLVSGAAPIILAVLAVRLAGGFQFEGWSWSIPAIVVAPILVFAAFYEEIVFRGYLLQNLLDIRRPIFGVVFTSVVFWLLHSLNPDAWSSVFVGLNLFGAGVLLALAYLVSGDIWFPTVMHFAWNFSQGGLFSIPVSGIPIKGFVEVARLDAPTWLTGGEFGLEGSAVTTIVEAAMIIVFSILLLRRVR